MPTLFALDDNSRALINKYVHLKFAHGCELQRRKRRLQAFLSQLQSLSQVISPGTIFKF